jgi:hypothetical protein
MITTMIGSATRRFRGSPRELRPMTPTEMEDQVSQLPGKSRRSPRLKKITTKRTKNTKRNQFFVIFVAVVV